MIKLDFIGVIALVGLLFWWTHVYVKHLEHRIDQLQYQLEDIEENAGLINS